MNFSNLEETVDAVEARAREAQLSWSCVEEHLRCAIEADRRETAFYFADLDQQLTLLKLDLKKAENEKNDSMFEQLLQHHTEVAEKRNEASASAHLKPEYWPDMRVFEEIKRDETLHSFQDIRNSNFRKKVASHPYVGDALSHDAIDKGLEQYEAEKNVDWGLLEERIITLVTCEVHERLVRSLRNGEDDTDDL